MEAKRAQAKAYMFLLGFFGGSKSIIAFWGWPEMALVSAFLSAILVSYRERFEDKREAFMITRDFCFKFVVLFLERNSSGHELAQVG